MAESLGLSAEQVLTTTRSVRKRLDLERPVDRSTILECIETAIQAPTGSNRQGWSWMVIDDPDKRLAIADHYRSNYWPYREAQGGDSESAGSRVASSADHLAENLHLVPAMVIPLLRGRFEGAASTQQASGWGSILPAAWSFMLALRARGLGSAWTTLHLPNELEVAELLGIDHSKWTQAGLFPVAYTIGTDFKLAKRRPAEELVHWNTWT